MTKEPIINRVNITRYGARLKRDMDGQARMVIKRLLTQVCESFALPGGLRENACVEISDKNVAPLILMRSDLSATNLVGV